MGMTDAQDRERDLRLIGMTDDEKRILNSVCLDRWVPGE